MSAFGHRVVPGPHASHELSLSLSMPSCGKEFQQRPAIHEHRERCVKWRALVRMYAYIKKSERCSGGRAALGRGRISRQSCCSALLHAGPGSVCVRDVVTYLLEGSCTPAEEVKAIPEVERVLIAYGDENQGILDDLDTDRWARSPVENSRRTIPRLYMWASLSSPLLSLFPPQTAFQIRSGP